MTQKVWRFPNQLNEEQMGLRVPDLVVPGLQICDRFLNEEEVAVGFLIYLMCVL
jgi:hypothetical protein